MKSRTGIIWLVVLALLSAGAAAVYWFRADIATNILRRAASAGVGASLKAELPDGPAHLF